ncbi:MAG: AAA family ATPase [Verrucomicrobiota bacterium]
MSYYRLFGLKTEPFSTSPHPDFFYLSKVHTAILYKAQILMELRRGLGVILGDVGVGKTTLLRKLYITVSNEPNYSPHVILDPCAESEFGFLQKINDAFGLCNTHRTANDCQKVIEQHLFQQRLEENKITVLFIDEGQRLSIPAIEILRTLLNYETNDEKLIQLILLGQMELLPLISGIKNFWDRIALKYVIKPLAEGEIRELINYRLKVAGYPDHSARLFPDKTVKIIYRHTSGYPRRVVLMCHNALEYLVMHDRQVVSPEIVKELIENDVMPAPEAASEREPAGREIASP